jgi:maltooligosyltrehalose trehalohydrolase
LTALKTKLAECPARRLPVGAEPVPGGGVHFRVWAPARQAVEVVLGEKETSSFPLTAEPQGYFSGRLPEATAGTLYRFRLDGEGPFPDPASRFQPEGPHGPSQVVDPAAFAWSDAAWQGGAGVDPRAAVLYEMHIGTFTREGTWAAAAAELPALAALGVTILEILPVADFPGRFGWGYDGVGLFAPTRLYGDPDALRRFVDQAHAAGLGVILDVVYNHLGPDGNYLTRFTPAYFSERHHTDWGVAINFDGRDSSGVRELYLANARYWMLEYHLDGLRLDATQDIHDDSPDPILACLAREVRRAGEPKRTYLVAENEPQHTRLVRPPEAGGYGLDALWNDDFHHSAIVALTGHSEAYYTDYRGTPQELVSAAKYGYLYQGQRYSWQKKRRGTPGLELPPWAFVSFLENHDQVANSLRGERLHARTSPGRLRALTALLLLGPAAPMLFQGQEFGSSAPFVYFADHEPDLARRVRAGRHRFLAQFPSFDSDESRSAVPDPGAAETFASCKLDFTERETHAALYALHRDLLALRRNDPVLALRGRIDGAVLGPAALVLRFFNAEGGVGEDRLLLVNLDIDLPLAPAPEPLLAPPEDRRWGLLWSSESPLYGGSGAVEPESEEEGWRLPGRAAVFLGPLPILTSESDKSPQREESEENPHA